MDHKVGPSMKRWTIKCKVSLRVRVWIFGKNYPLAIKIEAWYHHRVEIRHRVEIFAFLILFIFIFGLGRRFCISVKFIYS